MFRLLLIALCCVGWLSLKAAAAQEQRASIDKSRIPAEANSIADFVPPGWTVEEQVAADLNGDSLPDYVLKLIEDKNPDIGADGFNDRQRALVIAFRNRSGKLERAAIADRLLQCTGCGGAFYGVVEAPANVRVEKGVLIVNQDHGSRNVVETTYRFRYEPETKRFALIGLDVVDTDRALGVTVSESTNYLTGVKIIENTSRSGRVTKSRKRVSRERIYIEQVDHESYGN